jgi:DNA-binding MarR family transcriptional regulator
MIMSADDTAETAAAGATPSAEETAAVLLTAIGKLYRRIRQTKVLGDLSLPESSALSQLRHGPATSAQLAKAEHISPQSMGATLGTLEQKGLVARSPDPDDGRRVILSLTPAGADTVNAKRSRRTQQLTGALEHFSPAQRRQLIEALPLLEELADTL